MATASSISPSGMQIAGKYGIGVLSIASTSAEGLAALPTQWALRRGGRRPARPGGRPAQLAGADELAHRRDPRAGPRRGRARAAAVAQRVQRPRPRPARRRARRGPVGAARPGRRRAAPRAPAPPSIGTPDDLIAAIRNLQEVTGGFGVVLGFAHDWANLEATRALVGARRPLRDARAATGTLRADAGLGRLRRGQQERADGRRVARRDEPRSWATSGAAAAMATTMQQIGRAQGHARQRPRVPPRRRRSAGLTVSRPSTPRRWG